MCLSHSLIASSLLTIAHKNSGNRAELPLVFFVFEVDAISTMNYNVMKIP